MDTDVTENPRMFPALRLLEKRVPPTLYGHAPYWRAPITPASKDAFVPSWNWTGIHHELPEGDEPITLDINGAFLAALGAVQISHSQLVNNGPVDAWKFRPRFETTVWPGYYKVRITPWPFSGTIVSPFGDGPRVRVGHEVWVSHPTLVLLLELLEQGTLPELEITDSWVSNRRCDFRDWSAELKKVRNALLDERDKAETHEDQAHALARYKAFKEGYGAAFSMMLTGEICQTRRPDWAHAVYAQHSAASWRKAWRFSNIGPLLRMGSVDEFTVLRTDLGKALLKTQPPLRLDPSGRTLGHVKEKTDDEPAPEQAAADNADYVESEDWSQLL